MRINHWHYPGTATCPDCGCEIEGAEDVLGFVYRCEKMDCMQVYDAEELFPANDWAMIDVRHEDKPVIDLGVLNPITTRHVGTIAFQGTDAQINEAMQRYFGERK